MSAAETASALSHLALAEIFGQSKELCQHLTDVRLLMRLGAALQIEWYRCYPTRRLLGW